MFCITSTDMLAELTCLGSPLCWSLLVPWHQTDGSDTENKMLHS